MRTTSPETENLRDYPPTGQFKRNPQVGQSHRKPDMMTGNVNSPLVRRAPYLYEDDPLRQELAQQIEAPQVRRSSRYLHYDEDEE